MFILINLQRLIEHFAFTLGRRKRRERYRSLFKIDSFPIGQVPKFHVKPRHFYGLIGQQVKTIELFFHVGNHFLTAFRNDYFCFATVRTSDQRCFLFLPDFLEQFKKNFIKYTKKYNIIKLSILFTFDIHSIIFKRDARGKNRIKG
ncbi:hypothetical protein DN757_17460 [Paenibacillus silvae]|uniref:Uncharacterized protein n=1 Tax=Paenibacillus silvae TaxID=1325358 RepID=A0A2W6NF25_9BACL|nr:hypothetical protein DN757_17460 [Paenibacillus silvae]